MFLSPITFDVVKKNYKAQSPSLCWCVWFPRRTGIKWKQRSPSLPFGPSNNHAPRFSNFPTCSWGGGRASLYTDLAWTNHGTARAAPQNAIKWLGTGIVGSSARAFWALWCRQRTALRWESCSLSVQAPAIRSWRRAMTRRTDWSWTSRCCFTTAHWTASL